MTRIGPTSRDEPAVTAEGLQPFVEAARRQRTGPVKVDADALHRLWQRERRKRNRRWLGITAAAAAVLGVFWISSPSSPTADKVAGRDAPDPTPAVTAPTQPPPLAADRTAPVQLAAAITVSALDGSPDPTVRSPYALELPPRGHYRVEMQPGEPVPLRIDLGPDADDVELHEGVVVILLTDTAPQVTLESGKAFRVSADGTTRPMEAMGPQASTGDTPQAGTRTPTPAGLARRAERALRAGDRDRAIEILEQLVRTHPRASASRAGLLDLARLLKGTGQTDRARCAYATYLERWPHAQVRDEVEQAMSKLGDGPPCQGLGPQ